MSGLLSMDDTKRLTADEMLRHPWVAVSLALNFITLLLLQFNLTIITSAKVVM